MEEPDEEKFSRPALWTGEAGNWLLRVCEPNPSLQRPSGQKVAEAMQRIKYPTSFARALASDYIKQGVDS